MNKRIKLHPRRSMSRWMPALALVTALGCASSSAWAVRTVDHVVAVVNGQPLTYQEWQGRVQALRASNAQASGPAFERQVLEALIAERAQIQWARERGLVADDNEVQAAIQSVAAQNQLTVDALLQRLKEQGVSVQTYREQLRDQLTLRQARDQVVNTRVQVTESQIDQFLRTLPQTGQERLRLLQWLVKVPEAASAQTVAAAKAQAQAWAEQLARGADPTVITQAQVALGADGNTQPDMGLRDAGRYPDLFVQAVQGLSVGAVAPVVQSAAGFHVIKLVERKSPLPVVNVPKTRSRHILLRLAEGENPNAKVARMQALREEIVGGKVSFADAAKQISQDGSAAVGGDLGWVGAGQFVPEFESVMNALPLGQVSAPVVSRFGVHLIEVIDRQQQPLDESGLRTWARAQLREQKSEEALAIWARDVRSSAFVDLLESAP